MRGARRKKPWRLRIRETKRQANRCKRVRGFAEMEGEARTSRVRGTIVLHLPSPPPPLLARPYLSLGDDIRCWVGDSGGDDDVDND
jgi:hypothetical protein